MSNIFYTDPDRHATWLELFFDLVFAAAIGVVTHSLAHTVHGHISGWQLLEFLVVFIPLWWIWATHTLYANRFDGDSNAHRLFTLAIMGMVILLSTYIQGSLGADFNQFIITYVLIRIALAGGYFAAYRTMPEHAVFARDIAGVILVGALVSGGSIFFDSAGLRLLPLYAGIILDMTGQVIVSRQARNTYPVHRKHLVERTGLLAVIILGETVISIVTSKSGSSWDFFDILSAVSGYILLAALWWVYFGSLYLLERAKRIRSGIILVYGHLPFFIGLVLLANMVRHSILGDLDHSTFSVLAIVGLSLFYLGKQIPYMAALPPHRIGNLADTVICVGITAISTTLPRIEYSMLGMTFSMIVYVLLTTKWLVPTFNVDDYLEPDD